MVYSMPISISYNKKLNLLYCRPATGVSLEEFDLCMKQIVNSSEFSADINTIWITTEIDFAKFDKELQMAIIKLREKYPQRGDARIAIVAENPLGFGLGRMYQGYSTLLPQRVRIFRDLQSAEEWICTSE